jgi:hypothetical protein
MNTPTLAATLQHAAQRRNRRNSRSPARWLASFATDLRRAPALARVAIQASSCPPEFSGADADLATPRLEATPVAGRTPANELLSVMAFVLLIGGALLI